MSKKVFLGGTCNKSTWREWLIEGLIIDFFNPVVKDWTPDCQAEEIKQRQECDLCLYVITPKMTGVYSIAEVVDDSNKRPEKTIFAYIKSDDSHFTDGQCRSLDAVGAMVERNGGKFIKDNLYEVLSHLNSYSQQNIILETDTMIYGQDSVTKQRDPNKF